MTLEIPGYVELARLGEDPAGTEMLARYPGTGAVAVIRHLSLQLTRDHAFLERFREEAPVLEGLRHPNLVGVYDHVEGGGEAAVVGELADGVSLRELLRTFGSLEPNVALVVLRDVLRGLDHLHTAGLLHRDCTPESMVVTGDGEVRLRGAGLAVQSAATLGRPGTPASMAPELWAEGTVSVGTDVYAATAAFFECLTGHPPYRADDVTALREQHERAPIPAWEVPDPLRELVQRGLDKEPGRRAAGAAALLAALEASARAAYGEDWEDRARRRLAAMALSLAALFPLTMFASLLAEGAGVVATAAGTAGGRRRWRLAALARGAALLVVAGLGSAAMALGHVGPFSRPSHAAVPVGSPSPSPSPAGSASDSSSFTTSDATPTDTPSASPSPTPTATATATPAPTPTATPRPSPTPLAVQATGVTVQLSMTRCDATAQATVTTNGGAGSLDVTFSWRWDVSNGTAQHPHTITATAGVTRYTIVDSVTVPRGTQNVFVTVALSKNVEASQQTAVPHSC